MGQRGLCLMLKVLEIKKPADWSAGFFLVLVVMGRIELPTYGL